MGAYRAVCAVLVVWIFYYAAALPTRRPAEKDRAFSSPIINEVIANVTARLINPELAEIFANCFPNPLDTTVNYTADGYGPGIPDTFVITGDIPAMWLRDAMNQIWPYLPYLTQDPNLQSMAAGLINRMVESVLIDHYANAFNYACEGSPWQNDTRTPPMNPRLWEGKYELDTLLSVLRFSYGYYNATGDTTPFGANWTVAMDTILQAMLYQMTPTLEDTDPQYTFLRVTYVSTATLLHAVGAPGRYTGMVKSAFRPSDDSTSLPFLIPANAMAVVALNELSQLAAQGLSNTTMSNAARSIAATIQAGLEKYAIVGDEMLAYEVDGYANRNLMDDANVPSLLSLPYLGYVDVSDPLYQATRQFLYSDANPYYFSGTVGAGLGSPHTGLGYVWPMSIMVRAITTTNETEIMECLDLLVVSAAGTGFMHESFNVNNVTDYTRPWFAWANAFFGQVILTIGERYPHLIYSA